MYFYLFISLFLSWNAFAEELCTLTFNSSDEKIIFSKHLNTSPVELNPLSNVHDWKQILCSPRLECQNLVVSGHFGGIFFGEENNSLSLQELHKLKSDNDCHHFFNNIENVFLMGCNTLANKAKDHRSPEQYLKALLKEGFPIEMAENVVLSRYSDMGLSIEDIMLDIFRASQNVYGFRSTAPLGHQIKRSLDRSFTRNLKDHRDFSFLSRDLKHLGFIKKSPEKNHLQSLLIETKRFNSQAILAWEKIFNEFKISDYILHLLDTKGFGLRYLYQRNYSHFKQVNAYLDKLNLKKFPIIYSKVLKFKKKYNFLTQDEYHSKLKTLAKSFTKLDYINTSQICSMEFIRHEDKSVFWTNLAKLNSQSQYLNTIKNCFGIQEEKTQSQLSRCLDRNSIWTCLKENKNKLDIPSCKKAQDLNTNPEKEDHMLWYCYSKMRERSQLDRAKCLELAIDFKKDRNKLRMNWNCLNRIKK